MDLLFRATSETILSWCSEQGFTPGFVSILHTFGSTLNFHPHIHILLSEGGIGDDPNFDFSVWRNCKFFPEKVLKERFKYFLVKYLREWTKKKFIKFPAYVKKNWNTKFNTMDFWTVSRMLYKVTWYAWIGEKLNNARHTTRYIGRYAKRPCLSETKIQYYNRDKQTVRFEYRDKISGRSLPENTNVEEFIGRLIRHIPEKNYRMIRYYGFYANRTKNELMPLLRCQIAAIFTTAKLEYEPKRVPNNWRDRIMASTNIDPLSCPHCNERMKIIEIGHRTRDGTLKIYPIFH